MKGMRKKVFKILLSLIMVFTMAMSIVPTNVFAIENGNESMEVNSISTASPIDNSNIIIDGNNGYTLTDLGIQKAFDDIADGGIITLGGDVVIAAKLYRLMGSKSITLDLNGHTLDTGTATTNTSGTATGTFSITAKGGGTLFVLFARRRRTGRHS